MLRALSLDHIVLHVKDVETSLKFYSEILGLKILRYEEFKKGEAPFPSVRVSPDSIIDLLPRPDYIRPEKDDLRNVNHLAIVFERFDVHGLVKDLQKKGVEVVRGPLTLWGAKGRGELINILDPDKNSIEIRHY
jgi:catechol 2,3-dioxygenase-like lactoylglutathione lyase family enzyme